MNWISIKHGIPSTRDTRVKILAAINDGSGTDEDYGNIVVNLIYSKAEGFMEFVFGEFEPIPFQDKITHWMYYPDPPKR
jgi:hypothetical protein